MVTLPDSSRRYSTSSSAPCRAQNHLSSPGNACSGTCCVWGTCLHLLLDLVDEAEHDRLRHAVRQVAPHKVEVRRHELPCDINPEHHHDTLPSLLHKRARQGRSGGAPQLLGLCDAAGHLCRGGDLRQRDLRRLLQVLRRLCAGVLTEDLLKHRRRALRLRHLPTRDHQSVIESIPVAISMLRLHSVKSDRCLAVSECSRLQLRRLAQQSPRHHPHHRPRPAAPHGGSRRSAASC